MVVRPGGGVPPPSPSSPHRDIDAARAAPPVHVLGVGAVNVGGRTTLQVAMSQRAGFFATAPFEFGADEKLGPKVVDGAFTDFESEGIERLADLAELALTEAHGGIITSALPLVLAVPPLSAVLGGKLDEEPLAPRRPEELLRMIASRASVSIDLARSKVIEGEHTAGALALAVGAAMLQGPGAPQAVIVGGVDTYRDARRLDALAKLRRVDLQGRKRRAGSAFVPAEAAAFVVLSQRPIPRAIAKLRVVRVETEPAKGERRERAPATDTEEPSLLARMLAEVWEKKADAKWVLSDLNGESWRATEWTKAVGDVQSAGEIDIEPLGSDIGDVGAASAALYVAIAAARMSAGAAPGLEATFAVAGRDGGRAIGVVEGQPPEPRPAAPAPPERPSPAAESAVVGRRILDAQRRRFTRLQGKIARRVFESAATAFDRADAALRDLATSDLGDPAHLDRLATATHAAREVHEKLQRVLLGEPRRADETAARGQIAVAPIAEDVAGVQRSLEEIRPIVLARAASVASIARSAPNAPEEPRFVASGGLPSVFDLAPLVGRWPADASDVVADADLEDEDDDEPADDPSDDGEDPEIATLPPDIATSTDLGAALDSALETIGRLQTLRRAGGPIPWSPFLADFDTRMLAHLDLVWSLATPTIEAAPSMSRARTLDLVKAMTGSPIGTDEGAAFARALVLGCASAKETVRLAVSGLANVAPEAREAYAEALALASSPALPALVEDLCHGADPEIAALGAYILARRRTVRIGVVLPLLFHPAPVVRKNAAFALGYVPERAAATCALEACVADESEVEVVAAAVESLLRQRAPMAMERAARALDELCLRPSADRSKADPNTSRPSPTPLLRLMAVVGRPADWERMLASSSSPNDVACLGWYGRPMAIEPLITILAQGRPGAGDVEKERARSAARALGRITGAVVDDSPRGRRLLDPTQARSLGVQIERWSSDATLELDAGIWRAYWQARGQAFSTNKKYRFGEPWEPGQSLAELGAAGVLDFDRRLAALEYDLAQNAEPLPDTSDWVARQVDAVSFGTKGR